MAQYFKIFCLFRANHHSTIAPFLSIELCDSPEQAPHYHNLGQKLGASSLPHRLVGLGVKVFWFSETRT
jgi:hypothetical protein